MKQDAISMYIEKYLFNLRIRIRIRIRLRLRLNGLNLDLYLELELDLDSPCGTFEASCWAVGGDETLGHIVSTITLCIDTHIPKPT